MVIVSVAAGVVFGLLWGTLFSDRVRRYDRISRAGTSSWFLASTSIIRYLLLAALLALLVTKYDLQLPWWAAGFMVSFWLLLMRNIGRA